MDREELLASLRRRRLDPRVLEAVATVPREHFVPRALRGRAWEDGALPIAAGQTISQPSLVAFMVALLGVGPTDRVLDVGTGSGYHAAVLAQLARHVWSIERHDRLSRRAAHNLAAAGVHNVTLVVGDGTRGLPESAPYDAINVAAAGTTEGLAELEEQLAVGGRLIAPITDPLQRLSLTRRTQAGLERELLEEVRFVPLVRDD